jgi:hypothetical protein
MVTAKIAAAQASGAPSRGWRPEIVDALIDANWRRIIG